MAIRCIVTKAEANLRRLNLLQVIDPLAHWRSTWHIWVGIVRILLASGWHEFGNTCVLQVLSCGPCSNVATIEKKLAGLFEPMDNKLNIRVVRLGVLLHFRQR